MAITSLRGINVSVWIPPIFTPVYKITIERADGTVDDVTDLIDFNEVEDGVTETKGRFEVVVHNPNETYTGVWNSRDIFRYYKDYSTVATTGRFRGRVEKVSYPGNKVKLIGRSDSADFSGLTVTKQYTEKSGSYILKDLNTSYGIGFTTTNVQVSTTLMTVNWVQKPFFSCIEEIARAAGYDVYVDFDLDWNFFPIGSKKNTQDAIIHDYNLIDTGDFAEDGTQIHNRILVYGATIDGIQIIYTAEDSDKEENQPWVELIHDDDNITDYQQASEVGEALLEQEKTPPQVGDVESFLLGTLEPGEKLRISDPANNIPPADYQILSYKDRIDIEGGGLTTTVKINKEPQQLSHVLKKLFDKSSQQQKTSSNPHEMRFSFPFTYDENSGTHSDTEITEGVLKTTTGNATGNWVSTIRDLTSDLDEVYLILFGEKISHITISVSGNRGNTWEIIENKEKITLSSASGPSISVKVEFTNEDARVNGLNILYKITG